ncbi:flagellar export protein FliJ [Chitinibacteraceae bacterium HSL-7]
MAQFRFAFLLERAEDAREKAAQSMREAQQRLLHAAQKLEQVDGFRAEYRARLVQQGGGGMTIPQWRDYQAFLARLDQAHDAQASETERMRRGYEQAKVAYFECEKQVKAYEALRVRHQQNELKLESKREQKLNDEFNSRIKPVR